MHFIPIYSVLLAGLLYLHCLCWASKSVLVLLQKMLLRYKICLFPAAHARKGQALEKLGRVDEARTHYQHCIKILKHNSHFKEALKNLDAAQGLAERTAALHVS